MNPNVSIVITSINSFNKVMQSYVNVATQNDWGFIVAGDTLSPHIDQKNLTFLSIADQLNSPFSYAKRAPVRNYGRKNIAYLHAIKHGAEVIIETDDDNFPYDHFCQLRGDRLNASTVKEDGFVNVFRYFTDKTDKIWPRGFSLSDIKRTLTPYDALKSNQHYCPVQCGLVDNDPDVDAIYRLLFDLPFEFEHKDRNVAMNKGSWCSFNTQNTTFYKAFFPLMYQPSTPMFREADILRSFVAQRILWENDASLLFHSPTVWQERNEHDLILDLREEVRLYGYNSDICKKLEDLDIKSGADYFYDNMIACYKVYKEYQMVNDLEFSLISAWFDDLSKC